MKRKDPGQTGTVNPMIRGFSRQPDDCLDLIDCYGTYNIQPTADTENPFPAIAQGLPRSLNNVEITKDNLTQT